MYSSLLIYCTPLLCFSDNCSYILCTGGDFEPAPSLTKKYDGAPPEYYFQLIIKFVVNKTMHFTTHK